MVTRQSFFLLMFLIHAFQSLRALSLADQFKHIGYSELCDKNHGTAKYDALYAYFDELIEYLQANPALAHKLYIAKERFIRTRERDYYSTDFFGLYDESLKKGRDQIAFYYSIHFHEFICAYYKELNAIPQIIQFLNACREIQKSYGTLFNQAAAELRIADIFSSRFGQPPLLLKVVKYLSTYAPAKPHYDGTAFSLFLDSTDNQSLLLSAYKSTFTVDDFSSPARIFSRSNHYNSILLIPGTLLKEFSIDPTPHIVAQNGTIRYATIAFAMRPHHAQGKNEFSLLPNFHH